MNLGRRPRRREEPEPYQQYRQPLGAKWRPAILARDRYRCRVCAFRPKLPKTIAETERLAHRTARRDIAAQEARERQQEDERDDGSGTRPAEGGTTAGETKARGTPANTASTGNVEPGGGLAELEVAHITDAIAFVRAGNHHRAVTFSYRWDNLVTLCGECHRASHAYRITEENLERRAKVERLFERLRKLRGWSSPFAALPPELVPPALRPARSFHDVLRVSPLVPFPTYARYASDGGLVFSDAEAPPRQSTFDVAAAVPLAPGGTRSKSGRLEGSTVNA